MAELRAEAAARQPDGHRMPGLGLVEPDSGRGQPGIGQRAEGLPQPSLPEVQHVVVGQSADVRPGYGHARQVVRAHPVVHGLARGEVGAAGNAGLQVDDPDGIEIYAPRSLRFPAVPCGPGSAVAVIGAALPGR